MTSSAPSRIREAPSRECHHAEERHGAAAIHPPRRPLLERDEALRRIFAVLPDPAGETAPLTAARGRIAARDIVCRADEPAFARSAMDGYAFPASQAGATGWLPVVATIQAGDTPAPWSRSDAVARILTGAPLGPGLAGVIPQEDVEVEETPGGRRIRFVERPQVGDNVRPAGHSLPRDTRLVARGTPIGPAELAVLAGAGEASVPVARAVRVALASTGDELVPVGTVPLPPGKIYDSNTPMVAALLDADGAVQAGSVAVPDTLDATIAALASTLAGADLVLSIGGISVGDRDHVAPAAERLGGKEVVRGLNFRPGRPLAVYAFDGGRFLFALPGNPLSVLATYVLFVRPALDRLAGRAAPSDARAVLEAPVGNRGPRWWAALASLRFDGATLRARVDAAGRDSGSLLPLTRTTGFVLLAPDAAHDAGDEVPAFPLLRGSAA